MKETEEFDTNYQTKSPLRRLILLVAFTGMLLITSTYAWFTTQNSVKISGIKGSVGAVEGLEVSLDGESWTNNLALTAENLAAAPGNNILPEYLEPVSTTGTATDRVAATAGDEAQGIAAKQAEVQFYTGLYNAETDALTGIGATTEGYYAIDLYVKNTSSNESDILKLNNDSSIVIDANKESTGLQNTTRLGLALYEEKVADTLATKATVTGTDWGDVKDVTIWEPNANAHVAEVLRVNNKVTVGEITPGNLKGDSQIPTYALSKASLTAGSISNIYTWTTAGIADTGLQEQVTLQTTTSGIGSTPIELPSVDGTNKFALAGNGIYKLRVYLWLEGQDVDTINHASHGGSVTINLGLTKEEVAGGTTLAEITNDEIGEYIDLGLSLVGEEDKTTDDWRILWVDEEKGQVYAMLNDYLPNDVNGKNYAQLAGLNTQGTYVVNSTESGTDLVNKLKSTWTDLTTDLGIDGATVAGAPTGEMLQLSYNYQKDPDIVYTDYPEISGDMWVKAQKGDACGYWLASAYEGYADNVWIVDNDGFVDLYGFVDLWYGVCPVVCLSSDINAEIVEGIWTVTK